MSKKDALDALRVHHEECRRHHQQKVLEAVRAAVEAGFNVTVSQRPRTPLAMGHHAHPVDVRLGRQQYQAEMALEREIKVEQP